MSSDNETCVNFVWVNGDGEVTASGSCGSEVVQYQPPQNNGDTIHIVGDPVPNPKAVYWRDGLKLKPDQPDKWHEFDIETETWVLKEGEQETELWKEFRAKRSNILSREEFKLFAHYPSTLAEKAALSELFQQSRDIPETTTDPIEAMSMLNEIWGL